MHIYVCETTKNNVSMRKNMETLHKNTFEKILLKKYVQGQKCSVFKENCLKMTRVSENLSKSSRK